jgi:hypothetical protein
MIVAALLVSVAIFGGSSVAAGSARAAAAPSCTTSGLVVWLDTMGNGYAGGTGHNLEFTNLSGHTCTLYGYPGVSAVDLAGHQLGSAAARNAVHKSVLVTLANGGLATVQIQITDAFNYASHCTTVTAAGLRVYPPGQTASKVVPYPFTACSNTGPVILHVEAVQKGIPPRY